MIFKLDKNKKIDKVIIIGGIASFALILSVGLPHKSQTTQNSEFNKYSYYYLQSLDEMDYNKFDNNFINIYENGKYIIDGVKYGIDELYLVTTNDTTKHLIKAGENIDIITNEPLNGTKIGIICLKKTSLFYNMYKDGLITNNTISLSKQILNQYIEKWDGKKQYMVPELEADKEATEQIKKAK